MVAVAIDDNGVIARTGGQYQVGIAVDGYLGIQVPCHVGTDDQFVGACIRDITNDELIACFSNFRHFDDI